MKSLVTIVCVLMICNIGFAQQKPWFPFPFGQVSYYKDSVDFTPTNKQYRYTLSADSMMVNGTDTIVYFNRKRFANESLQYQPGSSFWDSTWVLAGNYEFLRSSFHQTGDSITMDSPWNFNQGLFKRLNDSTPCGDSIIYMYTNQWFDIDLQDSVRSIGIFSDTTVSSLLNDDMMRISKFHGLISFLTNDHYLNNCYTESLRLKLCGFVKNGNAWGFQPPTMLDYLSYQVGDVMKYHRQYTHPLYWITITRDSVTGVSFNGDSASVYIHRKKASSDGSYYESDMMYPYMLSDYERASNRTTGEGGIIIRKTFGLDTFFCSNLLFTQEDSCGTDTMIVFKWYTNTGDLESETFSNTRHLIDLCDMLPFYTCFHQRGFNSPSNAYSCGDFLPLSISELNDRSQFSISPNPTTDKLTINFHQPVTGTLQIIDATGRQLQTKQLNANALVVTNVEKLPSGIYFIRVQSKDSVYTGKFIKQ